MAAAFIQRVRSASVSGNTITGVIATPTTGNALIVVILSYLQPSHASVNSVTMSAGAGTFTVKRAKDDGLSANVEIWEAPNITSGPTPTITVTLSGSSANTEIVVYEFAGLDSGGALDGTNGGASTASPGTSGNITTTATGDLLIGAGETDNTISGTTAGWTGFITPNTNATEYLITTATVTQAATFTGVWSHSAFAIVAFKAATASGSAWNDSGAQWNSASVAWNSTTSTVVVGRTYPAPSSTSILSVSCRLCLSTNASSSATALTVVRRRITVSALSTSSGAVTIIPSSLATSLTSAFTAPRKVKRLSLAMSSSSTTVVIIIQSPLAFSVSTTLVQVRLIPNVAASSGSIAISRIHLAQNANPSSSSVSVIGERSMFRPLTSIQSASSTTASPHGIAQIRPGAIQVSSSLSTASYRSVYKTSEISLSQSSCIAVCRTCVRTGSTMVSLSNSAVTGRYYYRKVIIGSSFSSDGVNDRVVYRIPASASSASFTIYVPAVIIPTLVASSSSLSVLARNECRARTAQVETSSALATVRYISRATAFAISSESGMVAMKALSPPKPIASSASLVFSQTGGTIVRIPVLSVSSSTMNERDALVFTLVTNSSSNVVAALRNAKRISPKAFSTSNSYAYSAVTPLTNPSSTFSSASSGSARFRTEIRLIATSVSGSTYNGRQIFRPVPVILCASGSNIAERNRYLPGAFISASSSAIAICEIGQNLRVVIRVKSISATATRASNIFPVNVQSLSIVAFTPALRKSVVIASSTTVSIAAKQSFRPTPKPVSASVSSTVIPIIIPVQIASPTSIVVVTGLGVKINGASSLSGSVKVDACLRVRLVASTATGASVYVGMVGVVSSISTSNTSVAVRLVFNAPAIVVSGSAYRLNSRSISRQGLAILSQTTSLIGYHTQLRVGAPSASTTKGTIALRIGSTFRPFPSLITSSACSQITSIVVSLTANSVSKSINPPRWRLFPVAVSISQGIEAVEHVYGPVPRLVSASLSGLFNRQASVVPVITVSSSGSLMRPRGVVRPVPKMSSSSVVLANMSASSNNGRISQSYSSARATPELFLELHANAKTISQCHATNRQFRDIFTSAMSDSSASAKRYLRSSIGAVAECDSAAQVLIEIGYAVIGEFQVSLVAGTSSTAFVRNLKEFSGPSLNVREIEIINLS